MSNTIKAHREELNLSQTKLAAVLRSSDPRVDNALISKMETGLCLPTPDMMRLLEQALNAHRLEFYDMDDIDLVSDICKDSRNCCPSEIERRITSQRKCYRIPREFANNLPKDLLSTLGYSSWQSWHDAALRRALAEYAARKKHLKHKEAEDV